MKRTLFIMAVLGYAMQIHAQITDTGTNVGIGTTTPASKLHIQTSNATETFNTYLGGNALHFDRSGNGSSYIDKTDAGNLILRFGLPVVNRFVFTNNGNFGVGTTTPTNKLEINNPTLQGAFSIGSSQDGGKIYTSYELGSGYLNFVEYDDPFVLNFIQGVGDGFNEKIYFHQGSFGVGKVQLGQKFYVHGTFGISDHFTSFRPGSNTFLRFDDNGYSGYGSGTTLGSGANILLYAKNSSRPNIIALRNSTGEKLTINENGNVGIGTTAPNGVLEVKGISAVWSDFAGYTGITNNSTTPNGKNATIIIGETPSGTYVSGTGGQVTYKGGLSFGKGGPGIYSINPNPAGSAHYGEIRFHTTAWNSSTSSYYNADRMVIKLNGDVGIGTTTPDAKLAVNGKIHTKEVKVDLVGWPDYVFEKEYNLPTLTEVEKHIKKKGHLPNIPSSKEVAKEGGIELGKMNKKLLEKIEELTLYTIQQEKEIEELKQQNKVLLKLAKEIELIKEKLK